jgi:hypothetical protein
MGAAPGGVDRVSEHADLWEDDLEPARAEAGGACAERARGGARRRSVVVAADPESAGGGGVGAVRQR